MSAPRNAFHWYYLDQLTHLCSLRFDSPHSGIRITLIWSRQEPAHQCTLHCLSTFISLVIHKWEQMMNPCDKHSLHPGLVLILYNKDSIMPGISIPWGIASNVLVVHPTRTAEITRCIEAVHSWMKNLDPATEINASLKIIWEWVVGVTTSIGSD